MKKVLSVLLVAVFTLTLAGCVNIDDTPYEVDCKEFPTHVDCVVDIDPEDPDGPGLVTVLDKLPTDEDIEIVFWHTYGASKTELLQEMIDEFEEMYPNVTINHQSQGDYDALRLNVINALSLKETPTMILSYPDHVAAYLKGDGVIALDDFAKDETHGVDLDDFVPAYIEENTQYQNGLLYSFPFSKSTEMMVYNKDKFDANAEAIEAKLGYPLPTDRPITWAELDLLAEVMVGEGDDQCEFLINFDSPGNFFINNVRMWDGGYTNSNGEFLMENANTELMLDYVQDRFEDNTFVIPLEWEESYGSANFIAGDVCMSVGSTAGINYNIPADDSFEVGVLTIPQYDAENMSAVQQGPNIAIMKDTTDAERLASWLFIKYFTSAENTVRWAMDTGYMPVNYAGFNSQTYQDFLAISDTDDLLYYSSLAAQAGFAQNEYYQFDPAFAGVYTSSDARVEAGKGIESLFIGTTAKDVIQDMLGQLGQ